MMVGGLGQAEMADPRVAAVRLNLSEQRVQELRALRDAYLAEVEAARKTYESGTQAILRKYQQMGL